jgi:hypothetical protein
MIGISYLGILLLKSLLCEYLFTFIIMLNSFNNCLYLRLAFLKLLLLTFLYKLMIDLRPVDRRGPCTIIIYVLSQGVGYIGKFSKFIFNISETFN